MLRFLKKLFQRETPTILGDYTTADWSPVPVSSTPLSPGILHWLEEQAHPQHRFTPHSPASAAKPRGRRVTVQLLIKKFLNLDEPAMADGLALAEATHAMESAPATKGMAVAKDAAAALPSKGAPEAGTLSEQASPPQKEMALGQSPAAPSDAGGPAASANRLADFVERASMYLTEEEMKIIRGNISG
jgi:hypothetical protein